MPLASVTSGLLCKWKLNKVINLICALSLRQQKALKTFIYSISSSSIFLKETHSITVKNEASKVAAHFPPVRVNASLRVYPINISKLNAKARRRQWRNSAREKKFCHVRRSFSAVSFFALCRGTLFTLANLIHDTIKSKTFSIHFQPSSN